MRRPTASNPAFVCEVLPARSAVQIITNYLIDAAVSLTEGRGPGDLTGISRNRG
jgi:hypothetical protein